MANSNSKTNKTRWLDAAAVADQLGITRNTLYAWVRNGKIPAIHLGWTIRFDPADIARLKDKLTTGKF